ncbi:hypothetical protein UFOVP573_52 [uncultured Caudovirales phage]|uniref:Uncharacterized protein n=1 Tax=uncultured Caudovirales phage TaxID=2100421 RepID=A0A6J5QDH0_9CAUD|nr:hypothetical protein UFOVP288_63 [uncultured Caudovirales phage]CAB4146171.1 hypothetical protein UFOVP483_133 [uncultured Caudovirales phage]CAB4150878.1 hypothetical protein UFOVP573_52 [uncultured Caudovirales phage]CAB4161543.1 hypothetical protein UFOVP769_63 [uncultured Caudovirales phage]CAB4174183.1 hypothetical protein UFOVP962_31 [uncultured Caudovirales phage]
MQDQDIILTKEDWFDCDGCGVKMQPEFWKKTWDQESESYIVQDQMKARLIDGDIYPIMNQIDGGLSFELCGGYGEFFDCMTEDDIIKLCICHDCASKMFSLFNKTKKLSGLHPSSSTKEGEFCCEWGWSSKNGEVILPEGKM